MEEIELILSGALKGGKDGKGVEVVEVGHTVDFVFPVVERGGPLQRLTLAPDPLTFVIGEGRAGLACFPFPDEGGKWGEGWRSRI